MVSCAACSRNIEALKTAATPKIIDNHNKMQAEKGTWNNKQKGATENASRMQPQISARPSLRRPEKNPVSSKTQGTVQNSMQHMQIVDSRIQINNAKKSRNIQNIVLHFLFFACILDCCFKAFSGA